MKTKKLNVFDCINTLTAELSKKIEIRSICIECRIGQTDKQKDLSCSVFYIYKEEKSNFNVHFYDLDRKPISMEMMLTSCLIEVQKIITKESDIFTI